MALYAKTVTAGDLDKLTKAAGGRIFAMEASGQPDPVVALCLTVAATSERRPEHRVQAFN
jgi:hypothetical protein